MKRYWTTAEEEFLCENIGSMTLEQIAKRLNRTKASVKCKADHLHKSRRKCSETLSMNEVMNLLGITNSRKITEDWCQRGFKLKKVGFIYAIDTEELLKFLKKNQDLWNAAMVNDDSIFYNQKWYLEKRENDQNKKRKQAWNISERNKLRHLLNKNMTYQEISIKLNRTVSACRQQAFYLRKQKAIG